MSVASHIVTTLKGLLPGHRGSASARQAHQLEAVRQAMLDCLQGDGAFECTRVERSLLLAPDLESLWHLRPELLMAIAAVHGEGAARQLVGQISRLFDGFLPAGLERRRQPRARQA